MAIVAAMRALVPLSIVLLLAASGARAGETRCWFENGAVVVSAAFGDIAGDFILDLSAPHSQLHNTTAQTHGVEADSTRRDLVLAGEKLRGFEMPVVDLDARSEGFVTGVNGVLGADVLEPFVVDIRFSPCVVKLSRHSSVRRLERGLPARIVLKRQGGLEARAPGGSLRLKVRRIAGVPAVAAAISDGVESRQGWFAVDTASQGTRIAGAGLSRTPPKGVDPADRPTPPARLRALSLGGRLFEQTPAGLLTDAPSGLDGAIGDAVWSRYRLRLDLERGWLELAPVP